MEVLPRGVTQPLAAAKDLTEPFNGPVLDSGFDLFKKLQGSKRRILNAREMERINMGIGENPPKKQNTRSSSAITRRNSSRSLHAEFQAPDLSFLQNLASRSDGFNTSSSSHCKYT